MFQAQALRKTHLAAEFESAGFTIAVQVDTITNQISPDSLSDLLAAISQDRCDGFEIDLGTHRTRVMRPQVDQ
jgi:hypothetical protein